MLAGHQTQLELEFDSPATVPVAMASLRASVAIPRFFFGHLLPVVATKMSGTFGTLDVQAAFWKNRGTINHGFLGSKHKMAMDQNR